MPCVVAMNEMRSPFGLILYSRKPGKPKNSFRGISLPSSGLRMSRFLLRRLSLSALRAALLLCFLPCCLIGPLLGIRIGLRAMPQLRRK